VATKSNINSQELVSILLIVTSLLSSSSIKGRSYAKKGREQKVFAALRLRAPNQLK
jgi:hypothetical protein